MLQQPLENDLKKQMLEKKQVIVRIWTSLANHTDRGHSVGHISVEIPKEEIYWSLWPKKTDRVSSKEKPVKLINPVPTEPIQGFTYEKDKLFEKREPELIFCFYTLDVHKIRKAYENMRKSDIKWSLVGDKLFFSNAESCVSSAWKLLEAGGINNLVSIIDQSTVSSRNSSWGSYLASFWPINGTRQQLSGNQPLTQNATNQSTQTAQATLYTTEMIVSPLIKSPDYIGELLKKAKIKELEKEPLIKNITFNGETDIVISQQQSQTWSCNIL